jgi:hypothetical protein
MLWHQYILLTTNDIDTQSQSTIVNTSRNQRNTLANRDKSTSCRQTNKKKTKKKENEINYGDKPAI